MKACPLDRIPFPQAADKSREDLIAFYRRVRTQTEDICSPLQIEDHVVQPIEDVSPPKWHLGHTTWFFETMVLSRFEPGYAPHNSGYGYIFNSYYESFGSRIGRIHRGTLSRPTVREISDYRKTTDDRMMRLFEATADADWEEFYRITLLGLNHEQQHQELLITDIKYIFAASPLYPAYLQPDIPTHAPLVCSSRYIPFEGGLVGMGYDGTGFAWDNERPRHQIYLQPYSLRDRLVTNGEFVEFIEDGGYSDFRHWSSDGWDAVNSRQWTGPLYWEKRDNSWFQATLSGLQKLVMSEPVCHLSYFEADAFARWSGKRLPTEAEWENAARSSGVTEEDGNFMDLKILKPLPASDTNKTFKQMLGDVWIWTASAYLPYPGFKPESGALAEYNSKFMNNQMILRGGSCATPRDHFRISYRNFFQCEKRWQFSGIRLAE